MPTVRETDGELVNSWKSNMPTLQELLAQRASLEKQIETTQKQERSEAISKVKSLMAEYNLSVTDLSAKGGKSSSEGGSTGGAGKGSKVAAKFRNPATGDTWSGRGLQPKWLKTALAAGKKVEDFSV
ncbi:MAG: histone family protein nucleoid-structuring protein [Rhizobacter sp.]|nr:histone family protein nucleoid-structuring protein [Rhizobacter sp.]